MGKKFVCLETGRSCNDRSLAAKNPLFIDLDSQVYSNDVGLFRNRKRIADDRLWPGSIPRKTRLTVWRAFCGERVKGSCFCCDKDLYFGDWHCGHIVARAKGGTISPSNLRPLCRKCNLGMKTQHMYVYMILHKKAGVFRIPRKDPQYRKYRVLLQSPGILEKRLLAKVDRREMTIAEFRSAQKDLRRNNADVRLAVYKRWQ